MISAVTPHPARLRARIVAAMACWLAVAAVHAAPEPRAFGVIIQRGPVLTASYWNPILAWTSARSGVPLNLLVSRTGPDHSAAVVRGEPDFLFSNHQLLPGQNGAGYRVILRADEPAVRGEIVVLADSPLKTLEELRGKDVAFPSRSAVLGYHIPYDGLLRRGIPVNVIFGGNQEGAMGQLKSGRVFAAGVNGESMQDFAAREGVRYRVLWASPPYQSMPLAVHPRVPASVVEAVRRTLLAMSNDPEGQRILDAAAHLIGNRSGRGFVSAGDADYQDLRDFFVASLVREAK